MRHVMLSLPEQINETCYVDVEVNKAVFEGLKNNVKVHYDGITRRFSYKVNQFLKVAQKCQRKINESGSEGLSNQDLQSNGNMFVSRMWKSVTLLRTSDISLRFRRYDMKKSSSESRMHPSQQC